MANKPCCEICGQPATKAYVHPIVQSIWVYFCDLTTCETATLKNMGVSWQTFHKNVTQVPPYSKGKINGKTR